MALGLIDKFFNNFTLIKNYNNQKKQSILINSIKQFKMKSKKIVKKSLLSLLSEIKNIILKL